ncbi:MAG: uracil-DNA glycosylase, partial [Sulfurovum sp.]|nr:uracil-DNA glycosylase [Sulfurovaceae bacterium]
KKESVDIQEIKDIGILRNEALACTLCDLSKIRREVLFGGGNPNAEIMFISDSINIAQESSNNLFAGRSGNLLVNMIERVLLIPVSKIYFTNLIKCRPHNGQITSTEAHTCLFYLKQEIELVKPRIIVTLGIDAYNYLTGEKAKLEDVRGQFQKKDRYILIPTFHLTHLLRESSAKKLAFEDMKLIKNMMI